MHPPNASFPMRFSTLPLANVTRTIREPLKDESGRDSQDAGIIQHGMVVPNMARFEKNGALGKFDFLRYMIWRLFWRGISIEFASGRG